MELTRTVIRRAADSMNVMAGIAKPPIVKRKPPNFKRLGKALAAKLTLAGLRMCSRCGENRPLNEYFNEGRNKDKKRGVCKKCRHELYAMEFESRPARPVAESRSVISRRYRMSHPLAGPKDKWLRRYGVTAADYFQMEFNQGGVCAICGSSNGGMRLDVDHDHVTLKIRGLLCHACNMAIGHFKEDINVMRQAVRYLETSLEAMP